jgi:hypothetical protein
LICEKSIALYCDAEIAVADNQSPLHCFNYNSRCASPLRFVPTAPSYPCALDQKLDPATAFGILQGAFQLAQQTNQFKNRIQTKCSDAKELRVLREEAHHYLERLKECKAQA